MASVISKHCMRLGLLAVVSCMSTVTSAQVASPQDSALAERIEGLISKLDSPVFAERERASAELTAIGTPAFARLEGIPSSGSFELRQRARIIQKSIEADVFDALARKFLLDLDGSKSYGLPGWNAFRGLVGSSRTSKLLFLDMVREEQKLVELIEAIDSKTRSGADTKEANAELYAFATNKAASMEHRLYEMPSPSIGENMGLLFAAAVIDGPTPVEVSQVISRMSQLSFYGYLRKQGYRECLRNMLSGWIPKANDSMATEVMRISLEYDLAVIAPTARQHLSPNFDVPTRELAFQCLAKFGDESDITSLSVYFDDLTVVEEFIESNGRIVVTNDPPPGFGRDILRATEDEDAYEQPHRVVRINDLAAATAMLLLKEDPRIIFPNYTPELAKLNRFDLSISLPDSPKQIALIKAWAKAHAGDQNEG